MKKLIALALAALTITSLSACSGSSDSGKTESKTGSNTESSAVEITEAATEALAEPTKPQSTSDTTYNVGDFSVYVPAGWEAIPQKESADSDAISPNNILLANGPTYNETTNAWEYEECQSMFVTRYSGDQVNMVQPDKSYYDNTKDLEDMKIGNFTWQGFTVDAIGADIAILWTTNGDYGYQVTVSFAFDLTLEDANVQAIIGSLV